MKTEDLYVGLIICFLYFHIFNSASQDSVISDSHFGLNPMHDTCFSSIVCSSKEYIFLLMSVIQYWSLKMSQPEISTFQPYEWKICYFRLNVNMSDFTPLSTALYTKTYEGGIIHMIRIILSWCRIHIYLVIKIDLKHQTWLHTPNNRGWNPQGCQHLLLTKETSTANVSIMRNQLFNTIVLLLQHIVDKNHKYHHRVNILPCIIKTKTSLLTRNIIE